MRWRVSRAPVAGRRGSRRRGRGGGRGGSDAAAAGVEAAVGSGCELE